MFIYLKEIILLIEKEKRSCFHLGNCLRKFKFTVKVNQISKKN